MKNSVIALALSLSAACCGCDRTTSRHAETPVERPADRPIEVDAPGVQVKVDPQHGVEVKAPGVDIETK